MSDDETPAGKGTADDIPNMDELDRVSRELAGRAANCEHVLRVLVVDESALDRRMLVEAFKTLRCPGEVVESLTVEDCLTLLASGGFHAVIVAPAAAGLAVLTERSARGLAEGAAIVVLDDDSDDEVTRECMLAGATGVFLRPDLPSAYENLVSRLSQRYASWLKIQSGNAPTERPTTLE